MNENKAAIAGIGWVLPGQVGSGREICSLGGGRPTPQDNDKLAEFSAKPYLESVKGYLDPAGAYMLAAAALALGQRKKEDRLDERTGISTVTTYGATLSGYRFFEMFVQKGARFASPLIFPHGYANTAGNLAAIEFGFAGPHLVLYGRQDIREAVEFALTRLDEGSAPSMLVGCYESAEPQVLPDETGVLNGAIAVLLAADPAKAVYGSVSRADLWALPQPDDSLGSVAAGLNLLEALADS